MAIPVNAAASAATAGTATDSVRIRLILPRKTSVSLRCRNGLPSGAATPRNAHGGPQPCFISQITTTSQTATWRPVSTRVAAATGRKPWPYPLSRPGRYSRPHRTPATKLSTSWRSLQVSDRAELLGLKWTDVDLACRRLSVRRALKVTDQGLDFGPPKTRRVVGPYRLARRWWPFCTLTGPARIKRG